MKILGKELIFNGNKVYHTGNKPTASEIGAATSSHIHSQYAEINNAVQRWSTNIKCATWSRIMNINNNNNNLGSTCILNIQGTRANVLYNKTFIISSSHNSKSYIQQINTTAYPSNFQLRAIVNEEGDVYIEIYDNNNNATNAITQNIFISYIDLTAVCSSNITKYTSFTDGSSIPSGFSEAHRITTTTNTFSSLDFDIKS